MYKYLLITIISICLAKQIEIQCPSHCRCDFFQNYKRANCINQKLVVLESLIPPETEILDISFNQISHLDDHAFHEQNLLSLKLLNISHNKISQIHLNAFEGLGKLKTLDLSNNAMQYLLIHWFWSLNSLTELYLKGNQFGNLGDDPVIESRSLKILDLSKCGINHLGFDVFSKIPNLEHLDLSKNELTQLHQLVITPLRKLELLKIDNNSFICNQIMDNLTNYCQQHGISYKNPCIKPTNKTKQFEKMISLVEPEQEKNSWIYDDDDQQNTTNTILYNCTKNEIIEQDLLKEIVNLSPLLSVLIPFIYGICVGILIGCCIQIKMKPKENLQENTYVSFDDSTSHLRNRRPSFKRNSSVFSRKTIKDGNESLMLSEWNISESTPVSPRKFNQDNL